MNRPIRTESTTMAGIPVLHVFPAALQGPAPTLLFYHGWSSRKESQTITAESLAIEGFRVILPEAPRHGVRDPLPEYNSNEAWELFWDILVQAIHEAEEIVGEAIQTGLADPARIGVGGNSMGGMIASGLTARHDWVKAAAICNGNPCYEWLDAQARKARAVPPADDASLARLRSYDPEALVERVAPRPFLMLHGENDTVVPVACARRFLEVARPHYRDNPDLLSLVEVPRLDHYVTTGMIETLRAWLVRYV